MAFCVRLLLQQMLWTGRPEELFELLGGDPRQMDLVDARNLLLRLGYGSRSLAIREWRQLNNQVLPGLYLDPLNTPWVLWRADSGAVVAAINLLGPGLGEVSTSFATMTPAVKWLAMCGMLIGRLEVFTLLILFLPSFWRH